MVIWKFEFRPEHEGNYCTLSMPKQRQYLALGAQPGPMIGQHLVMWAMVDPNSGYEDVEFAVVGTGWDLQGRQFIYRGTVQMESGLVWHVLEFQP